MSYLIKTIDPSLLVHFKFDGPLNHKDTKYNTTTRRRHPRHFPPLYNDYHLEFIYPKSKEEGNIHLKYDDIDEAIIQLKRGFSDSGW